MPGSGGWWWTAYEKIVPRPDATTQSQSVDRHWGHMGPGGWRSSPQPVQRWMRSSRASTPSQKKALSRLIGGRGRRMGGRDDPPFAFGASGGRNFSSRMRPMPTSVPSAVW